MASNNPLGRMFNLQHFVVVGPGEWTRGTDYAATMAACRKRVGGVNKAGREKARTAYYTVFASDGPLEVFVEDRVRVKAAEGHVLVSFEAKEA